MLKDSDTISNEYSELKHVADKLGVMPSDVLRAKEQTGTSSRAMVEEHITNFRDKFRQHIEDNNQDDN